MRAVVTVTGTDRRGVVAQVSKFLCEKNINIQDMSQTLLGDQFAMIMIVDTSACETELSALAVEFEALGKEIGMNIRIQHADIFDAMHSV